MNLNNAMTNEEYRALPGLSSSDIKQLYRSPAHYIEYFNNPPESTDSQKLGTAIHAAILQPMKFREDYVAFDDAAICAKIGGAKPRATTVYKDWKANFTLDNLGRKIINSEDYETAIEIARAVGSHRVAGALLSQGGDAETPIVWNHHGTNTPMKARPDYFMYSGRILDIKTTEDARPSAFMRAILKYEYFLQAAVYVEGIEAVTGGFCPFTFIAIEKQPPYAIMVYELEESALQLGISEVDRCIREYEFAVANDNWPAYAEEIRMIQLPAYANVTEVY